MATVMIVDDALIMRKTLRAILEAAGHTVVAEAEHGYQALESYGKHRPDIVTMDLNMYGMGGLDTIGQMMKAYPDARILVISALGQKNVILDAMERGARYFIVKPTTSDKVSAAVRAVLEEK